MKKPIAILEKTPFAIDPVPMEGCHSARAGAGLTTRIFRSFKLPASCEANLLHHRCTSKDFSVAEHVESLCTALLLGIERLEDVDEMRDDDGLTRIAGYQAPSARASRDFLEKFHDPDLVEAARQSALEQQLLAYIPESNDMLAGLGRVLGSSARQCAKAGTPPLTRATVDADATVVESGKSSAAFAYTGVRGYQPAVAMWAEADAVLAVEFRDGNVPARYQPLNVVKSAFSQLPGNVDFLAFRGDSAFYERELIGWLCDQTRPDGPEGRIEFAISAVMGKELHACCKRLGDSQWTTFATEKNGVLRQWAELAYVPSQTYEQKDSRPLRYVGLRLVKPQGELFDDGAQFKHIAICTNRTLPAVELIDWHRAKAGTIEHVHDELKNALAAAAMPSQLFGANAAWFTINCLAYNIASSIRAAVTDDNLRTARIKRLRLYLLNIAGRIVRDRRKIRLRLAATAERIALLIALFEKFPLRTVATG